MKRIILLLTTVMFVIPFLYASGNDKEYKKLIQELGIDAIAMKAASADGFWNVVWQKNERLCKFYKAFDKKKSSAVKANDDIGKSLYLAADYFKSLEIEADNSDNDLMGILEELGALKVFSGTKLYIVNDEETNAFVTPDGRIYLNSGLFVDGMTYPHILGICAHEFAHFILQHAKVHCYEAIKKERKNNIIAGVSAAIQAGSAMYAASNGVESDWTEIEQNVYNMFESAALQSQKFRYKYSRKQEIEADIIAFRLLEYLGYGGEKYIEALSLIEAAALETPLELFVNYEDSTHPSTSFRVGLLEYMASHPEITRKEPKEVFE